MWDHMCCLLLRPRAPLRCVHTYVYTQLWLADWWAARTHFHCGSMRRACEARSLNLNVSPLSGPQRLACTLICCFDCNNPVAQQFHLGLIGRAGPKTQGIARRRRTTGASPQNICAAELGGSTTASNQVKSH